MVCYFHETILLLLLSLAETILLPLVVWLLVYLLVNAGLDRYIYKN